MRTFLLFLIGLLFVGAYFLFESQSFRTAAVDRFPQLKPVMELTSNLGKDVPQVKTAKIEKGLLVGAWRSEDNGELLYIREDGSFRGALACIYETQVTPELKHFATCTAVVKGGWTSSLGQFLLISPRAENVRLTKMKFGASDIKQRHNAWTGALIDNKMRQTVPKQLEASFNDHLKDGIFGGYVTVLSAKHLTLKSKDGEVRYVKVDPRFARDPDGVNAPTFYSSGSGSKYEKLPSPPPS